MSMESIFNNRPNFEEIENSETHIFAPNEQTFESIETLA